MKKRIFKVLSVVLALALIIGTVSTSKVSAFWSGYNYYPDTVTGKMTFYYKGYEKVNYYWRSEDRLVDKSSDTEFTMTWDPNCTELGTGNNKGAYVGTVSFPAIEGYDDQEVAGWTLNQTRDTNKFRSTDYIVTCYAQKDASREFSATAVYRQKDQTKYTITVKGVDEKNNEIYSQVLTDTYFKGAQVQVNAPLVEGYTLTGSDMQTVNVDGNKTVTFKFKKNFYTVSFYDDDKTTLLGTRTTGADGKITEDSPKPTKTVTITENGKTYEVTYTLKFFKRLGGGSSDTFSDTQTVREDCSYYAVYNDRPSNKVQVGPYYTVTFCADGKELKSEQVMAGKNATAPDVTIPVGKTFAGWDKAFANVMDDLTVNAIFNDITFIVKFFGEDGNQIGSEQEVVYGQSANAPEAPEVTGKTFERWDKDFSKVTDNLNVTATYTVNQYKVTFVDYNGEKIIDEQYVNHGEAATAPSIDAVPCPDDKHCTGFEDYSNITADRVVEATYADNDAYTLTVEYGCMKNGEFVKFEGKDATFSSKKKSGETVNVEIKSIEGYAQTDIECPQNVTYNNGKATFADNATLQVIYEIKTYTITIKYVFDDETQTQAADDATITAEYGAAYEAVTSPAITGYTPDKESVPAGNMAAESKTINVVYKPVDCTVVVNFEYENGTKAADTAEVKTKFDAVAEFAIPEINGYVATCGNDITIGDGKGNITAGEQDLKGEAHIVTYVKTDFVLTYHVSNEADDVFTEAAYKDELAYLSSREIADIDDETVFYTFAGWYMNASQADNMEIRKTRDSITPTKAFEKREDTALEAAPASFYATDDLDFYAVYETVKKLVVSFNANGHGTAPAAQYVKPNGKAVKPANLTAAGWVFDGWYTEAECNNAYDFNTAVTEDIELFARWIQETPDVPYIPIITSEPTPEPTPEVTPVVTPEPTPEVTPVVTPEPTPEPTPEVTPEPVEEPEEIIEIEDVETPEGDVEEPEVTPEPVEEPEEIIDIELPEVPEGDLPKTGTAPVGLFYGLGSACVAFGGLVSIKARRKEDEE